ncbi:hypothetical protein ACQJBY_039520 [Aegilops geniculata]
MEHLRRLAQFLLVSARGDGAGRRRPSPRTRPRTTAPWTAGRATARSPPSLTAPRQSAPRPQILLPSAATSPRPLVRDPQLLQRWEEPCDDMLPRPCIRRKRTEQTTRPLLCLGRRILMVLTINKISSRGFSEVAREF